MKNIAVLLSLAFISVFASSNVNKEEILKQLTDTQFELYTYRKRVEYLEQKVDEAACMVRFYTSLALNEVGLYPHKKLFQSKKKFLAEEKEYFAKKEENVKKLREANLELSQMPEYQELQLVNKEIEKLKEKFQQILVVLQQSKA